jgi:type IV pilus assembly protein PilQ
VGWGAGLCGAGGGHSAGPPGDGAAGLPTGGLSPSDDSRLGRHQITSGSTKVLASPTLILAENSEEINAQTVSTGKFSEDNFLGGISTNNLVTSIGRTRANESAVVVGERIINRYEVQAGQNGLQTHASQSLELLD